MNIAEAILKYLKETGVDCILGFRQESSVRFTMR